MSKIREQMRKLMIEEALNLFLEESISDVKMSDIAKKLEIGEATLYRYFGKKESLIYEAAITLYENIFHNFKSFENYEKGIDQIKQMYNFFLLTFKENEKVFKFIYDLDNIILPNDSTYKFGYENTLNLFKDSFIKAYNLGLKDGSVKQIDNIELFYYTTSFSLLNLCKSLAHNKTLLHQDEIYTKLEIITKYIEIVVNNINAL